VRLNTEEMIKMNTVCFLEKLANDVHHSDIFNELISMQSTQIKEAFVANNNDALKKQLSDKEHFADNVAVVSIVS
jgi:hypothetical protein